MWKYYPTCKIVVTSRIAGYDDELTGFIKLELREFDEGQIQNFLTNWFGESGQSKKEMILGIINDDDSMKNIAKNPLIITIIGSIYEEVIQEGALPRKRTEIYRRCVDALLFEWDEQKGYKSKYPRATKEIFLRKLSFYCHNNNKREIELSEIKELFKNLSFLQI